MHCTVPKGPSIPVAAAETEARGGQEGGLAAMSQLGLDPSVHGGGKDCEGGEGW